MSILENINDVEPCGIDFKYDDEYISIELEIEKNFNVSNVENTQWDIVILKCENVLTNHSKDLKILSYWLYAQWQLNGWSVFLQEFNTYTSVLEKYTKELFPNREKRKIKVFEWMENVLEDALVKAMETFEKQELEVLYATLERLEEIIPEIISVEFTFFKNTRASCTMLLQSLNTKEETERREFELQKQEELKRQEEAAALSEAEQARRSEEEEILAKFTSSEPTHVSTQTFVPIESNDIDRIKTSFLPLAQELLDKSPGDFIGYKILFSLAEILLEEVLRDSSILRDDLIPSNDIISVTRSLEEGTVTILQLNALIEQLVLRPTWLEGYYIVFKILYKLSQTNAATQIEDMLFYFLSKEEKITEMMVGNQKIVPEHIVSWIQTKLLSLNNSDDTAIEYQRVYQEVMKIKKEENAQNALIVLEEHYKKAQGEEARFRWRLLMVDFALEIGDKKLALSLLYELERLIEKYQINIWQPTLAVSVYEMCLKPLFTLDLGAENKERIYSKLSILDIQKVINL